MLDQLNRDALEVAPWLLGKELVHDSPEGITSGYIVEVEAYRSDDPASHAYRGQTLRNAAMFKESGTIYVYFTYGMHYCMNIVTGSVNEGQGVLIRALQPLQGVELMKERRTKEDELQLTNGPAKLVQALGVTREHNLTHLNDGAIRLLPGFKPDKIIQTPRIGISQATDLLWRFVVADNPYVSGGSRYNKTQ